MKSRILFSGLGLVALVSSVAEVSKHGASDEQPQKPLHEQTLELLRNNDKVAPESVAAHPVAAVYNREAIVPPQCYTQTSGSFNPCYVCHQDAVEGRENLMNDRDLQEAYSFSELGQKNHWRNLFEDRSERVAAISDDEIATYIDEDNYSELEPRLKEAGFEGWIPDLDDLQLGPDAFDENGFAKDGSAWVAFNFKPLPSTFWPTNGSTDDVMIRLPEAFRVDSEGRPSLDVYRANLAILEAKIKGLETISCLPVDETTIAKDLDGDGQLGTATRINVVDRYVGGAEKHFIDTHLYPEGTEFLHSVRYVGVTDSGEITVSKRMKELRYMKKWRAYPKEIYARKYQLESYEKRLGNLPGYTNLDDWGLDNGSGWSIQGFIEDGHGRLRVSTYEENMFCMGCHNSIGSTIDKTFSFPRKLAGARGWGYVNLKEMPDAPSKGEREGEILTYLRRVGGGSEFRNNEEMQSRWFKPDGTVDEQKVHAAPDVYSLITPSPERAMLLNKAYRVIVEDQDFIYGRDATVTPPENVYERIENGVTPTLPEDRLFTWNILLDWQVDAEGVADAR